MFHMLVCEHQCETVHYNGGKNGPKQFFSSNIVVCVERFSKYSFPIIMPYFKYNFYGIFWEGMWVRRGNHKHVKAKRI